MGVKRITVKKSLPTFFKGPFAKY